jgi:hypothetical protein
MDHRHITDTGYSLAAIDSVIERGQRRDWALLQISMRDNVDLCRKVLRLASHNLEHPYTIRYHYWYHYARGRLKDLDEGS